MQHIHTNKQMNTLSERLKTQHALNEICAEAIHQQIARGEVEATHLRNRRRYLRKQILKRIPHATRLPVRKLLHAVTMVLAMWGFAGLSVPQQASAAPVFKHVMLNGFDVGGKATPTFADIDNDGDLDMSHKGQVLQCNIKLVVWRYGKTTKSRVSGCDLSCNVAR